MKFIVRKAEEKDIDFIAELYNTNRSYPYSPFGREKREIFREMLSDFSRYIFVGEKNGNITAFVSMKIENRFENFFSPSAVINDIRASGDDADVLCAIISRAIAVAMENECREILLFDKNVNSKKNSLYSICGFRESNTFFVKKI